MCWIVRCCIVLYKHTKKYKLRNNGTVKKFFLPKNEQCLYRIDKWCLYKCLKDDYSEKAQWTKCMSCVYTQYSLNLCVYTKCTLNLFSFLPTYFEKSSRFGVRGWCEAGFLKLHRQSQWIPVFLKKVAQIIYCKTKISLKRITSSAICNENFIPVFCCHWDRSIFVQTQFAISWKKL